MTQRTLVLAVQTKQVTQKAQDNHYIVSCPNSNFGDALTYIVCVHAYTFIVCLLVRLIPRLFVGGDLSSPPTISCVSVESQCKSLICISFADLTRPRSGPFQVLALAIPLGRNEEVAL